MEHIDNGDFGAAHLAHWTLTGDVSHSASQGNAGLGCAALAGAGAAISQPFMLDYDRTYTVALYHQQVLAGNVTVTITNSVGAEVWTQTAALSASWTELTADVALPLGSYTLTISTDASARIDDVTIAHIAATRAALAASAHADLGTLATTLGMSTAASGSDTEGDYTQAVTAALQQAGAIDPQSGQADVRWLEPHQVPGVIQAVVRNMLPRLHNEAALLAQSRTTGAVTERFSLLSALEKRLGITPGQTGGKGSQAVVTRRLVH